MNRRNVIKSFFLYGLAAAAMGSVFELLYLNQSIDKGYVRSKKALITALAELIIPATDTPGATDANVADYIIHAVMEQLSTKDANNFVAGLHEVEEVAQKKMNKDFLQCSVKEQTEVLLIVRKNHAFFRRPLIKKIDRKLRGTSFFESLKELTVVGFCSSEVGATAALRYDFIPTEYKPCIPLEKNQPGWATK
ncbi:gluconate 2-dehydrogenase subunit 3 family protein [Niabella insulamsoli]|uniref:gluconate 2-dehydrogenase subunit 3 family protein n=1 Tax=Niabella insulamsoli TaxID=3144874 RepID=UPI0031FD8C15